MTKILVLKRDVTLRECPWLDNDLKAGTPLWTYEGHTYRCISPLGRAVSLKATETPFFEIPQDAV